MIYCAHLSRRNFVVTELFLEYCVENGYMSLMQWASNFPGHVETQRIAVCLGSIAVAQNDEHMFIWLMQQGFRIFPIDVDKAAQKGMMLALEVACSLRFLKWDPVTVHRLITCGRVAVLQWGLDRGFDFYFRQDMRQLAVLYKHDTVVEWIDANAAKIDELSQFW